MTLRTRIWHSMMHGIRTAELLGCLQTGRLQPQACPQVCSTISCVVRLRAACAHAAMRLERVLHAGCLASNATAAPASAAPQAPTTKGNLCQNYYMPAPHLLLLAEHFVRAG